MLTQTAWTPAVRPQLHRGPAGRAGDEMVIGLQKSLWTLEQGRANALRMHFGGKKFQLKFAVLKNIAPVGSDAAEAANTVTQAAMDEAKKIAVELLKQIFENIPFQEILELLTENIVVEIASQVAPFLGPALNVVRATGALKEVVTDAWGVYKLSRKKVKIAVSPTGAKALEAVKSILKRRIARSSIEAGRFVVTGSAQIGVSFSGYGTAASPAIGLASALTGMIHKLVWIAYEYYEVRAVNKLLKDPAQIDLSIFDVCPLMGCYALTSMDTDNIIDFVAADMGRAGWVKDVGHAVQMLQSVIDRTKLMMYYSSYELVNPKVKLRKKEIKAEGNDWRESHPALGRGMKGDFITIHRGVGMLSLDTFSARIKQKTSSAILHPQRFWREWAAIRVKRSKMEGRAWDSDV
jgi:hypothetical protein